MPKISIREKIGYVVSPKNLEKIPIFILDSNKNEKIVSDQIKNILSKTVFNINNSAKVGAKFIQELNEEIKNND